MKDDRVYLRHIQECLSAIERYVADKRESFLRDRETQKATFRELQELAESTQELTPIEVSRMSGALHQQPVLLTRLGIAAGRACHRFSRMHVGNG